MSDKALYKRCGCHNPATGKRHGSGCPKLRRRGGAWSPDHGRWHYQLELPASAHGTRRLLRRGGFEFKDATVNDRDEAKALLRLAGADTAVREEIITILLGCRSGTPLPDADTLRQRVRANIPLAGTPPLSEFLPRWLKDHTNVDASTTRGYEAHIRLYLVPHLGALRVDQLKVHHINDMFAALRERNARITAARQSPDPAVQATVRGVRTLSVASFHRIRATLRAALRDAIIAEYITTNAARNVKLGDGARPKAREWTDERVTQWRRTGHIPSPVMVWTPAQTGAFLDHAADDPLYALYHLIAFRGLRRGEACGVRRFDLDLRHLRITIANQISQLGWKPVQKKPKSRAGDRTIALDETTVAVLRDHLAEQDKLAQRLGFAWHDSGMVFTRPDGQPLHPQTVTERFQRLVREAALPPIRLHDLRHGAASIAHAGGADLKSISKLLGHSTIAITADTYTEVLADVEHAQAAASAAVVPLKRHRAA